jgi:hypothetical protein
MNTTLKATETSKKEVIADSIRSIIKDLNKALEKAYENGLIVNVESTIKNFEELEEIDEDEEVFIPHLTFSANIFQQIKY